MKRHRTLYAMKQELKVLATAIKAGDWYRNSYHYRHLHITRCLLKGRTIEQIEPFTREDNKRDEKYLEKLMLKWQTALQAEHAEDAALAVA